LRMRLRPILRDGHMSKNEQSGKGKVTNVKVEENLGERRKGGLNKFHASLRHNHLSFKTSPCKKANREVKGSSQQCGGLPSLGGKARGKVMAENAVLQGQYSACRAEILRCVLGFVKVGGILCGEKRVRRDEKRIASKEAKNGVLREGRP